MSEHDLQQLNEKCQQAGIDPALVAVIIQAVIALVKWWRDREKVSGIDVDWDAVIAAIIAILQALRIK
jgi:hypothetical protein